MSTKKRSFWEKYAIKRLSLVKNNLSDRDLYTLDEKEQLELKKIRNNTYLNAAMAGTLGIVLLYVPYHIFGESLFPKRSFFIPFMEQQIELEIEFLVYSVILVFLEIYYLTYINLKAATSIANCCGNLNVEDPNHREQIDALIKVGLEKKQKDLEKLGINPYEGLSKWAVTVFQVIVKLKATVSGFVWKLLVTKILGRYAFRMLVDLLGAPIYACWNMYASHKVMNEARVRILAPPLIHSFTKNLKSEIENTDQFKEVVFKTLQLIATSKRSFHFNHYLLASALMEEFDIKIPENPEFDKSFILQIDELSPDVKEALSRTILLGIIIDGNLNFIEKKAIKKLQEEKVISYTIEEVKQFTSDFFQGKGLDQLLIAS